MQNHDDQKESQGSKNKLNIEAKVSENWALLHSVFNNVYKDKAYVPFTCIKAIRAREE